MTSNISSLFCRFPVTRYYCHVISARPLVRQFSAESVAKSKVAASAASTEESSAEEKGIVKTSRKADSKTKDATLMDSDSTKGIPLRPGPPVETPRENRVISPRIQNIVDQIVSLSLFEVSDLNYALKKKLNLSDTPTFAQGMPFVAAAAASAAQVSHHQEEAEQHDAPQKITFSVKLTKFDAAKKIALIKEIRNSIPGFNLVQAKKFVDSVPAVVKEDLGKTDAEALKASLEKVGATCEVV
ncbi:hypothetical protein AB6A40_004691 [Gnathostoma spinigerum]|uniref:Uncharacterized protein n=1 Tax=Gnathostoma spinigerum TaxID=75299 RepID=A0ABD6EFD8_9BILA